MNPAYKGRQGKKKTDSKQFMKLHNSSLLPYLRYQNQKKKASTLENSLKIICAKEWVTWMSQLETCRAIPELLG